MKVLKHRNHLFRNKIEPKIKERNHTKKSKLARFIKKIKKEDPTFKSDTNIYKGKFYSMMKQSILEKKTVLSVFSY